MNPFYKEMKAERVTSVEYGSNIHERLRVVFPKDSGEEQIEVLLSRFLEQPANHPDYISDIKVIFSKPDKNGEGTVTLSYPKDSPFSASILRYDLPRTEAGTSTSADTTLRKYSLEISPTQSNEKTIISLSINVENEDEAQTYSLQEVEGLTADFSQEKTWKRIVATKIDQLLQSGLQPTVHFNFDVLVPVDLAVTPTNDINDQSILLNKYREQYQKIIDILASRQLDILKLVVIILDAIKQKEFSPALNLDRDEIEELLHKNNFGFPQIVLLSKVLENPDKFQANNSKNNGSEENEIAALMNATDSNKLTTLINDFLETIEETELIENTGINPHDRLTRFAFAFAFSTVYKQILNLNYAFLPKISLKLKKQPQKTT